MCLYGVVGVKEGCNLTPFLLLLGLSLCVSRTCTHTRTAAILGASPSAPEEKAKAKRTLSPHVSDAFSFFSISLTFFPLQVAQHFKSCKAPWGQQMLLLPHLSLLPPPPSQRLETSIGGLLDQELLRLCGVCMRFLFSVCALNDWRWSVNPISLMFTAEFKYKSLYSSTSSHRASPKNNSFSPKRNKICDNRWSETPQEAVSSASERTIASAISGSFPALPEDPRRQAGSRQAGGQRGRLTITQMTCDGCGGKRAGWRK